MTTSPRGLDLSDYPGIQEGIELLNEKGPTDWPTQINIERLDMASYNNCILGQLFHGYHQGKMALEVSGGSGYGFTAHSGEWKEYIELWLSKSESATEVRPVQAGDVYKGSEFSFQVLYVSQTNAMILEQSSGNEYVKPLHELQALRRIHPEVLPDGVTSESQIDFVFEDDCHVKMNIKFAPDEDCVFMSTYQYVYVAKVTPEVIKWMHDKLSNLEVE